MAVKIALISGMRGGKDTFAEPLLEYVDTVNLKFAEGITDTLWDLFPDKMDSGKKQRELYQSVGQFMRSIDPDVWVNHVDWHYRAWLNLAEVCNFNRDFIITDLRQTNEYQWCRDNGFTIVRINTPAEIRKQRIIDCGEQFEPEQFYHETESHIDSYAVDYEINGDCTKAELQLEAVQLFDRLQKLQGE